jgi:hypothetical protein
VGPGADLYFEQTVSSSSRLSDTDSSLFSPVTILTELPGLHLFISGQQ